MPAKSSQTGSDGFTAAERAAMKQRAAELRAEGRKGAQKADGLQAVLDSIAKMAPEDRAVAERVHATVSATAPNLSPKTSFAMGLPLPAEERRAVVFDEDAKAGHEGSGARLELSAASSLAAPARGLNLQSALASARPRDGRGALDAQHQRSPVRVHDEVVGRRHGAVDAHAMLNGDGRAVDGPRLDACRVRGLG